MRAEWITASKGGADGPRILSGLDREPNGSNRRDGPDRTEDATEATVSYRSVLHRLPEARINECGFCFFWAFESFL